MVKPAEKASEQVQGAQAGSGVFGAVGETIGEIAQTTKALVVGDEEVESGSKTEWRSSSKPTRQEQGQEGGGIFQTSTGSYQEGGDQNQRGGGKDTKEGGGIGETIGQYTKPVGQTVGCAAQTMKKPLDAAAQGGSEVTGAVGETLGEIGETMIKPAEKASKQEKGAQAGSGVSGAVGETITEIAQTTKEIAVGDDEVVSDSKQSIGSEFGSTTDRGNQAFEGQKT